MYHAFFIVLIFAYALAIAEHWPPSPLVIVYATLGSAALIGFLLAFPQLAFKPQKRALSVDYNGVQTVIGRRSGKVPWDKVANIVDEGELLYINLKNGNAFIIPRRAFACDQERASFYLQITEWHSDAHARPAPNM
jgi:hypothetical protein